MEHPIISVGTLNISTRAKQLVMQVLDNNRLSYGPMQQQFEKDFSHLHGCRFGVMSNSGTSALHIALAAMKEIHGWQDGDEIIVPAVTFVATVNIVLHNNLCPVFVDVEKDYYGLDPSQLEAVISPHTRAIIPVHLFGLPCDMDAIQAIAEQHDLKIIEDSCETMFSGYKGQPVGSMGDIGCFSTYVAHLLVTGVGGMNTTNNPDYATHLRSLMNHGRDSIYISIDDDNDVSVEELKTIIARRFSFVSVGHSFRVTEMEAALGIAQFEEWQTMLTQRRGNAMFLSRLLAPFQDRLQLPAIRPECEHAFMMYPIVLHEQSKEKLVNFLEERGVETRDMMPITPQPVYQKHLGIKETSYPTAQWINKNGFYIGCHQDLNQTDLEYVAELFERYWRQKKTQTHKGATLILITRNSETQLKNILELIPIELFTQIIAFDDGSTDKTPEILTQQKIPIIPAKETEIFNLVCLNEIGLRHDDLVFFPVDGRHNVRDIARLLLLLERGNDMVIASRFIAGGGRRPSSGLSYRYRSTGNRIFNMLADILFYANITDAFSRFRAMKRSKLATLKLTTNGLALYYSLSIKAMKQGWRIEELPTVELIEPTVSLYWKNLKNVLPALKVLISEWFSRKTE